jgi:hypothetical protein
MPAYSRNPFIESELLPVDIVFHPSWWHKHAGIAFDEDFFYHPLKRVESEQKMEKELFERFGEFGLGKNRKDKLPVIGAVHNAAGYLLSEMLGCRVKYLEDSAPHVIRTDKTDLITNEDAAFRSAAYKKVQNLIVDLKKSYGYVVGDINWGGVLNIALDLNGEEIFTDFYEKPGETKKQFLEISGIIERFVTGIASETGTTSLSVNRNVINIKRPVFLHSECSHTMISTDQYEEFLLPIDLEWSKKFRPFGIHYCGRDPHRYAGVFGKIRNLDFLDVGWGGDLKILRAHLPNTFLNIRLDPVNLNSYSADELEKTITTLVNDSANPFLTGVCCINMDEKVDDEKVITIFRTVEKLRKDFMKQLDLLS